MTQFNASTYDVQRPTGQCAFTGQTLEPEQVYIATLVEDGDELRRLDISMDQWEQGRRPDNLLAFWKATVPNPQAPKKLFVDDQVLMNLLERLEDAHQPQRVAFRFVLALILMRKKLLRYDRVEHESAEPEATDASDESQSSSEAPQTVDWWLLTPKVDLSKGPLGKWDEQRQIRVRDPHLDETQIREVTDQLGQILAAEL
jgi:hypothetical protein